MKQYTSRKTVRAKKLNLGDYNKLRGWEIPEDENPDKEGYLVEYLNSPNNTMPEGFNNYISWSPKDVFEKSHKEFNPKSKGCIRVGVEFNPSSDKTVEVIKALSAELIDRIDALIEPGERSEKARCVNVAMNKIEEAAMWAVKANFR